MGRPWRLPPVLACLFLLLGCGQTSVPEGCVPVSGFEIDRYLGRWYEIARLDHSFERGMSRCTAEYSLRDDGRVQVLNRGYLESKGRWKEARGIAAFLGDRQVASLKVSFFGPFYGGYHVIALDPEEYTWAMVAGPDRSYLWILSRTPQLPQETLEPLLTRARGLGFPVDRLIFVDQGDLPSPPAGGA